MIARIRGEIVSRSNGYVIIETGGIGYKVRVPDAICTNISSGQEVILHTELIVRQDNIQLYGFHSAAEVELFRLLISVSHVGPQTGLAILNRLTMNEIYYSIVHQKSAILSKVPGIGKKGADRIILELKTKITEIGDYGMIPPQEPSHGEDALLALKSLGYNHDEAEAAVHVAQKEKNLHNSADIVKEALTYLRKKNEGKVCR